MLYCSTVSTMLNKKCNGFLYRNHAALVVWMLFLLVQCNPLFCRSNAPMSGAYRSCSNVSLQDYLCMCNTLHYITINYSTPASYTFEKCEQFVVEVHEYWWATTNFGWNTNDLSVPSFIYVLQPV